MKTKLKNLMRQRIISSLLIAILGCNQTFAQSGEAAKVRLKDLVRIQGVERVDLVGYGVVVGLNKTGDKDIELAKRTVSNLMKSFNIFIDPADITSKNVAVVMVTGSAPAFHRSGDRIDVQVASMGDATSLHGGILLMTPMLDVEGRTYAVVQGSLTVGGYSMGTSKAGGATETKNFPTVGRIIAGGLLRYDHDLEFIKQGSIELILNNPDFTTAQRIAEAVGVMSPGGVMARDAGTVSVRIPSELVDVGMTSQFIASLELLRVAPDRCSRIVINERTGTIVLGGEVMINSAIIAHGNLTVRVGSTLNVSQPAPFSRTGDTVVTENIEVSVKEEPAKVMLVPQTTSIQELADVLNQLGASPNDLISILEALRSLGALQTEIIVL